MAFPTPFTDGQNATIGGIVYVYNSTKGAWTKVGAATSASSIVNGNSNVVVAANSNVTVSVAGNASVLTVTGTGANISGTANISGNANVGNLGTATAIITTGNITTINSGLVQNGNSNVTITANSNVTVSVAGNASVLTVTGTGANLTGNITTTGIKTDNYYYANGSVVSFGGGGSSISNGTSNINIASSGSNITVGVAGTANVIVIANDSFFVSTVRNDTSNIGNIVTYNPTSKEITYANQLTVMQTQLYLNSIYF